jgi:hypothetical protein
MAIPPPWALHIDGSNCFNRLAPIGLTGTVDNTSLTVTALDGQVVTTTGGCIAGGPGRVTGINIPCIANHLNGPFTNSAEGTVNVAGDVAQSAAPALRLALKSPELSPSTRPAIRA